MTTAKERRDATGRALRDPERENFVQVVFTGVSPTTAWAQVYDPEGLKSVRSHASGGHKLIANELVAERLNTLYAARAAATIDENVISAAEVLKLMVEFRLNMNVLDLHAQEAKGLDMLAKATGVYKAPEKNEKPRERTDAEIKADLERLGYAKDDQTRNRTVDGPSGRAADPQAADVQSIPEAAGVPPSRLN